MKNACCDLSVHHIVSETSDDILRNMTVAIPHAGAGGSAVIPSRMSVSEPGGNLLLRDYSFSEPGGM